MTDKRCSCPGCPRTATYEVVATNAGDSNGKRFYTCNKHSEERDFRREI